MFDRSSLVRLLALVSLALPGCCSLRAAGDDGGCCGESTRPHHAPTAGLFPEAHRDLALPGGDGPTLQHLVDELVDATGIRLVIDEETRAELSARPVGLSTATSVPAANVYPVVEGLLVDQGFVLRPLHGAEPPLLGLSHGGQPGQRSSALEVPAEQALELARSHPALLMTTQVHVVRVDARQLAPQLRGLMTNTHTQALIHVGENGIRLTSPGRGMASFLEAIRAAEAAAPGEDPSDSET